MLRHLVKLAFGLMLSTGIVVLVMWLWTISYPPNAKLRYRGSDTQPARANVEDIAALGVHADLNGYDPDSLQVTSGWKFVMDFRLRKFIVVVRHKETQEEHEYIATFNGEKLAWARTLPKTMENTKE